MRDEPLDNRISAGAESGQLPPMSPAVVSDGSKPLPDLRAQDGFQAEVKATLPAPGLCGGALLGGVFGLIVGIASFSLPGLLLGPVVGTLVGAASCVFGLVVVIVLLVICEIPLRIFMRNEEPRVPPTFTRLPGWEWNDDPVDTAIQQRPSRRRRPAGLRDAVSDGTPMPGGDAIVPQVNALLASLAPHRRHARLAPAGPPLVPRPATTSIRRTASSARRGRSSCPACIRSAFTRSGARATTATSRPTRSRPSTRLPRLPEGGVETVVVCGIATNICCFFARDLRPPGSTCGWPRTPGAGIDMPAAGLFQDRARTEGEQLGIEYVTTPPRDPGGYAVARRVR